MTGPPPLPAAGVRPHRAQKLLILAALAFVFAPCGFVAILMVRRDLKAMAAGEMDRAGEPQTRLAKTIAIVASIVWAMKWAAMICGGVVVYLNWDHIRPLLP